MWWYLVAGEAGQGPDRLGLLGEVGREQGQLSFAGEWPAAQRKELLGEGRPQELEGWDKGDKRQRDRKREPAFSLEEEEGTPHLV